MKVITLSLVLNPYPGEHAARIHPPSKSRYSRFARKNGAGGAGVDFIYGRRKSDGKMEVQAIRFKSSKFTVAQAKKWLKDHKFKCILFEPAKKKKTTGNTAGNFQRVVTNFKSLVRHDSMEGKDYLVVPMIMLTEGVHSGTCGPLYYPKREIAKTPEVWNTKPVIVYHPAAGESACTPDILTNRKIGTIMNAVVKDGLAEDGETKGIQLHAEAWLEEPRIKKVDERVMNAIENEMVMELSTGLYTDNEEVEGEWNGEPYSAIARNYRPDHLAILPDLVGACSVADGAGFLRLNEAEDGIIIDVTTMMDDERKYVLADKDGIVGRISSNLAAFISNELSHGTIRTKLYAYLKDKVGSTDAWIEEVFDDFFIYNVNERLFKLAYTVNKDEELKVQGIPEEVFRVTQYKNLKGKVVIKNEREPKKLSKRKDRAMDKKELVDKIIENEANQFGEDDREALMATDEATLAKMIAANEEGEEGSEGSEAAGKKGEGGEGEEGKTKTGEGGEGGEGNEAKVENKQTVDEYINKAPDDVQQVLRCSVSAYKATKAKAIEALVANDKCTFTKEQLEDKGLVELRSLLRLAGEKGKKGSGSPELNFDGQGEVLDDVEITKEEPLVAPVMNFDSEEKKD